MFWRNTETKLELSIGLPIIKAYGFPEATLQDDHICSIVDAHTMDSCRLKAAAVYTRFDAALDTPEELRQRLLSTGHFKR